MGAAFFGHRGGGPFVVDVPGVIVVVVEEVFGFVDGGEGTCGS